MSETPFLHEFEVDKLSNSIVNTVSGDSFQTDVRLLTKQDLKSTLKRYGWNFDWKNELGLNDREVFKLTITGNQNIVQGIASFSVKKDHVFLNLLESAPFNIGRNKLYEGVPGNLVAFGCKLSFQRGGEGFMAFHAKTALIEHYQDTLGAVHAGGHLMVIDSEAAAFLIEKYFKN